MANKEIMIELKKQWALYKDGEKAGKPRSDLKSTEDIIIKLCTDNELDLHDFDKRWATRSASENSTTISKPTEKEPFTEEKAEEIISEKEFETWKPYFRKAIAIKKLAIPFIEDEDPSLKGNPAGSGQIVNMGFHLKLEDSKKVKDL